VAPVLALLSSLLWGTSDFAGGVLARRHPVALVLAATQSIAMVALAVFVAVGPGFRADGSALAWGAGSGAVGAVALLCFYRGLASGLMGVVAPIAATGAAVPVLVGVAQGERPTAVQVAGIVVGIIGVVLVARPGGSDPAARHGSPWTPVLLAAVAAAGFGAGLAMIAQGSQHNAAMTLVAQRAISVIAGLAALLAVRPMVDGSAMRADALLFVVGGIFDLSANALFAVAAQDGLVSIVGVLSSLYPVVTVLLARRVLAERLGTGQSIGIGVAVAGVLLMATG